MGVYRRVVTLVTSPHMRYGTKMRQLSLLGEVEQSPLLRGTLPASSEGPSWERKMNTLQADGKRPSGVTCCRPD